MLSVVTVGVGGLGWAWGGWTDCMWLLGRLLVMLLVKLLGRPLRRQLGRLLGRLLGRALGGLLGRLPWRLLERQLERLLEGLGCWAAGLACRAGCEWVGVGWPQAGMDMVGLAFQLSG